MAINVLMLGWELPPYNSGGLGTACLGLTEGLSATTNVNIRFVVPHVFGTLPYNHMEVVSARDYTNEKLVKRLFKLSAAQEELISRNLAYGGHVSTRKRGNGRVDTIEYSENIPFTPELQARYYALQATAIARKHPKFDLIHSHDWMTYYAGMATKKVADLQGRKIPFVAQVHATEIDRCGENGDPDILAIERAGLHAADRVVAVSHYTKEVVHKAYGVPRSKISVVHNGIPTTKQPLNFGLHEFKKHHKIVVFMGRITMQKGPDYFVKLAKQVTDTDPSVRFIMIGSGDMEKRCIEEAARYGLTGKLLFSSFLRGEDVDRAYQLADLFVMPSVSEPFGIVALEAMQNGTPVLVSKQSGVAEVSDHIIKVDFWDTPAMRDAVLHLLHNPEYANHLREASKQDLQHLSWDQAAQKMHDLYAELLAQFTSPVLALEPVTI